MKATDKQDLCRKLITLLRPKYGTAFKQNLPVLETMLFAVCLENAPADKAQHVYDRVFHTFHDLNEARVSSIFELERLIEGMSEPDLRGLRLKATLHYVFEKTYSFEFEALRRMTQEKAVKELGKIRGLTSFCREFAQQHALDAHVLPIDDRMNKVLVWMGVVEPKSNPEHSSEVLRGFVRKADAKLFCHLLHAVSNDPTFVKAFEGAPPSEDDSHGAARLQDLLANGGRKTAKKSAEPKKGATASKSSGKSTAKAKTPAGASSRLAKSSAKKK